MMTISHAFDALVTLLGTVFQRMGQLAINQVSCQTKRADIQLIQLGADLIELIICIDISQLPEAIHINVRIT